MVLPGGILKLFSYIAAAVQCQHLLVDRADFKMPAVDKCIQGELADAVWCICWSPFMSSLDLKLLFAQRLLCSCSASQPAKADDNT